MGKICTEKLTRSFSYLFSSWNSLALSRTSCYSYRSQLVIDQAKLYINIDLLKTHDHVLVFRVFGDNTIRKIISVFASASYLSHYIHINTAKVNILKSCPRLCPLSLSTRTKLFFFFPLPGNHHSINIPPRYKVLMSACLLRLTLISPKVSEQGGGEEHWGKRGKKSCLHTQPTDVVELLSSLGCPLVSLRDAWWQRWGSESCGGLRGGGSAPLRVPCHGRARPGPCATVSGASSVSTPYAPGHCREGTRGAVTRRPQLQSGDRACSGCPLSRLILQF